MREEKIAEAHRLRAQGLSYSQIAGRLGVVKSTAVKWINPEMAREANRRDNARRAAAKRAWKNEHDRPLCRCGNRMTIGAHRKGQTRCAECRARDDREHTQVAS